MGPHPAESEHRSRSATWAGRVRRSSLAPWVAAAAAVLLLLLVSAWFSCGFHGCPDPSSLAAWEPGGAPVILDRNGEEFTTLVPVQREIVSIDSLPEHVGHAFIAVEDRRFRDHGGVDLRRMVGALVANLRAGGVAEGGSTITMQLARNAFPEHLPASRRTVRRKLGEIRVAGQIEDAFDKDQILGLYLNQIYFGNGATGIAAAARHYFDIPPSELAPHQAALLAAMVKAPAHYDPRHDPEDALERRNLVLDLMQEAGYLDAAGHEEAKSAAIDVVPAERAADAGESVRAPWFLDAVKRELDEALGTDLYRTQVRVHTTIDPDLQAAAEQALLDQLAAVEAGRYGAYGGAAYDPDAAPGSTGSAYLQGAVVVLDAREGDVLALVGGRNHRHSSFDHVFDAERQVGSAFKPFVYGAALREGVPPSHPLEDEPISIEQRGSPVYRPSNYDDQFRGRVTAREALRDSRNVPTVRLAQEIGTDRVAGFAEDAGIDGDIPRGPSMALGTVTLSPMELARAYASFAGLGRSVEPRFVRRVESADDGRTLWESEVEREERIAPAVAYILNDMLAEAVDRGTGSGVRAAGFRGRAAGKTGTTQNSADVWFVGYSPEVVGVVWMGFDQPEPILPRATGGALAAPVWGRMMARGGRSGGEWEMPDGVVRLPVDPGTGRPVMSECGGGGTELFLEDRADRGECSTPDFDSLGYDTLRMDSLGPDTMGLDTLGFDTLDVDTGSTRTDSLPDTPTVRPDSVLPDTASPDTTRPDTIRPDTIRPDTLPPDTLETGTPRVSRVRGRSSRDGVSRTPRPASPS